jgi:hypothetical protein
MPYLRAMTTVRSLGVGLLLLGGIAVAASKPHVVAFGKWTTVKWMVGEDEHTALDLKVHGLLVDGQPKEFTTGTPHDVTDHTFVVQRVFRLTDSLSQETAPERWQWERGGWLLVNRVTGKSSKSRCRSLILSILLLPGFATTLHVAESPTMERKRPLSSCNSEGASPYLRSS